MLESFDFLFGNNGFMPHGHCFLWTPGLLWLFFISDSVIALSYYSIPVALWYFVRKRTDLPVSWVFVMFGVFVMACGTTHLLAVWNIWHANYWEEASIKAVTAIASLTTAVLLWPLVPRMLAWPSPQQLREANQALQLEVARRTEVESELRRANHDLMHRGTQLENANKELEAFGYAISHDLRAPLRAVRGFAEILARHHRSDLNETGQHYLDNIVTASANMDALIHDLLGYSRLGRAAIKRQVVDLDLLLGQIAANFEARCAQLDATLEIPAGLPAIDSDRTLLAQILSNLIDNALTYHRSEVRLRVQVSCRDGGGDWILCVADNGIGIAADQLERIFIVFQRLHSAQEYPGTGIGLALVKKAAQALGGSVWCESEVGKGSAFYVRLPKQLDESVDQV
ncbi:MAG: ATP-binding protein [Burkholderiaceae bacterium]|nr:ATP-binding protein [Burkholderiaceae bacterium]